MEGVFMKKAFDDSGQGKQCICEECEEEVEGIVSRCQERGSARSVRRLHSV